MAGTVLSVDAATQIAQQAGFSGSSLDIIVAIAQAESSLRVKAVGGPNGDGTYDYGILQINTVHMGEKWPGGVMSISQAYDPLTAFKFGYWLSNGGTNFSPWSTYNEGKYKQFLSSTTPTTSPTDSSGLTVEQELSLLYMAFGHYGIDPSKAWNILPISVQDSILNVVGMIYTGQSTTVASGIGAGLWALVPASIRDMIEEAVQYTKNYSQNLLYSLAFMIGTLLAVIVALVAILWFLFSQAGA